MDIRRNKRGIKVKRCCASCANKNIDEFGVRHCTLGYDSSDTCRHWRMREELRNAGTPFGAIKSKEYLRFVLNIRNRELDSGCFKKRVPLRDIEEIRKEYKHSINLKF